MFVANVRFKSTRNSSEYKYRNWRENFFKRKSLDFVLHLETKIINSKVSYFKLASIFFFFFFASIIATNERERSRCLIKSSLAASNDKIKASFRLIRQVVTQYFEKSSFSRRSLTRVNSLQFSNAFHIPVGSCHSPSGLSHQRWRGVKKKRKRKRFHSFSFSFFFSKNQEFKNGGL